MLAGETKVCGKDYFEDLVTDPSGVELKRGDCGIGLPRAVGSGSRDRRRSFAARGCPMRWYSAKEACDLLGTVGRIIFDGDSLIRQLVIGVTAILSGNLKTGGINALAPPSFIKHCACEHQWQCYKSPVNHRFVNTMMPQYTICPNWSRDHLAVTTEMDINVFTSHLVNAGPNVLIVSNGKALHKKLNTSVVLDFFDETLESLLSAGVKKSTLIPMTVHWPGPNKPKKHRKRQGEGAVLAYNAALHKWAEDHEFWLLDTYAFTYGEFSRDGVHYDDLNVALGQIFLNYVDRLQKAGLLGRTAEPRPLDNTTYDHGEPTDVGFPVYAGSVPRADFYHDDLVLPGQTEKDDQIDFHDRRRPITF